MFSQSESVAAISKALVAFHKEVPTITKTKVGKITSQRTNTSYSYKYADLSDVLAVVKGPLTKNGLTFTQFPDGEELTTQIMHESGEWMRSGYPMKAVQETPQAVGSAITYARRYALGAALGLDIDDDDDGGSASSAPAPSPVTASGNDFGTDPAPGPPQFATKTFTVKSVRELTSQSGGKRKVITTDGGAEMTAFANTMGAFEEGHTYRCEVEVKTFRGKPDVTVHRVLDLEVPDPSEQP